jgi:hypothetical protein
MKIKNLVFFIISFFIILFSSIRGLIIYHFHINPSMVYGLSSFLLLILGLYCYIKYINKINNSDPLYDFKKLIRFNSFFLLFYLIIYMVFLGFNQFSILYTFLIFPIIFTLINFQGKYLKILINFIVLITGIGVFIFYKLSVNGGFNAIEEANLLLRPGELDYARIGDNILPAGYQGNNHDAANILVMGVIYYLTQFFIESKRIFKLYNIVCFFIVLILAVLTGSASNIALMLLFVSVILLMNNKTLFFLSLIIAFYAAHSYNEIFFFIDKFTIDQKMLEGNGMFNSLDFISILKSFPALLVGFGYLLEVPLVDSEIAFIKILVSYGFVSFIILFFLLLMPLIYIRNFNKQIIFYNQVAFNIYKLSSFQKRLINILILNFLPILIGMLSLVHYGSLFRITSIGLFTIFYALFFKNYLLAINLYNLKSL